MSSNEHTRIKVGIQLVLLALPLLFYIFIFSRPDFRPPEGLLVGHGSMLLIALLNGLEADHKSEEVAKARDEAYSDPILRGRNFHDSYLIRSLLPPSENELLVKTLICILVLLAAIVLLNTSFTEHGYFGGPNTLYTILIVFAAVPMGHAFGICIVRLIRRLRT